MKALQSALASLVSLAVLPATVFAHHSFTAQYDRSHLMHVTGTVTRVDWRNPHVYFYVDVKDAAGVVTNWAFESSNLSSLMRAGWRKNSLQQGDVVSVEAFPARDGSHLANSSSVTKSDGTKVYVTTGSAERYPDEQK